MKSSLSHLPKTKQDQILKVAEIIKEVVSPEKIILFGSYAKGNFVEHRYTGKNGIIYEYISDYDFLIVTKQNNIKDYELEDIIINKTQRYKVPINLQIHEIDYINKGLEFAQYFFTDIIKEGILLYDSGTVQFSKAVELSPTEQKKVAENYFRIWYNRYQEFFIDAIHAFKRNSFNKTIFELHQAAETLYYTVLLVFTGYKPKSHNLHKLRKYSKQFSEELFLLFPIEQNKNEKHLFDLLKSAYIDARYNDDFIIGQEEVIAIIDRIKKMRIIIEKLCLERIESIETTSV